MEEVFESGAKRSEIKPPFYLIPLPALRLLAERLQMGATKYAVHNWMKARGDVEFIRQFHSHLVEHLWKLDGSDDEESVLDNVAAVFWNAMALAYYCVVDFETFQKAFPRAPSPPDKG